MENIRYGTIQSVSGSNIYVKLDGDSSITQCLMSSSVPYALLVPGKKCVVTEVRNRSLVTDVINEKGQDNTIEVFNTYQVEYLTSVVNNTIYQTINQVDGELSDPGLTSRRYFTHAARLTRDLLLSDEYIHVAIPSFSNDEVLFAEQLPQGNFEYMLTTSGPETIQTGELTEYRYSIMRGYFNTTPRNYPVYLMVNGLSRTGFIVSDSRDSARSPFLKVSVWNEPGNWSSEKEVFRIGNLNPILGIVSPTYGFATGDLRNGGKYIVYNESDNSLKIKNTDIIIENVNGPVFQAFAETSDPYEMGTIILGNPSVSSFRWTPSLSRVSIFIGNSEVIYFDSVYGSRISGVLSIGDITGPQIHIGKIENQASIIARNSEDVIKFNLSTLDDDIVMHIGNDISRPSGWMRYQNGTLETRGAIIAESLVITGGGIIPPGGTLTNFSEINVLEENSQNSSKLMIRPRYMEGRDSDNMRTMIMAWNTITLPLDPNDPGGIYHTWIGGEMSLGDHRYRHFRVERGPDARVGLFDGDVGKAYLDATGNLHVLGTGYFTAGDIGGWQISNTGIWSDLVSIDAIAPSITMGNVTWLTGNGIFLGKDSGVYKFKIGALDGIGLVWDGDELFINGTQATFNDQSVVTMSDLDMELMKMSFSTLSWAGFCVLDTFENDTNRLNPETATYPARTHFGKLDNGDDISANREFVFHSQIYWAITRILTGTSTSVGDGYLEDSTASWFLDQYKNYELYDDSDNLFLINSSTTSPKRLLVSGTPVAGNYKIWAGMPTACMAWMTYLDSTNGGYGTVKLEASWDAGAHYQVIIDTDASINNLGGILNITNSGTHYQFKITLKNDALGRGPIVYKCLIATDPSVWK